MACIETGHNFIDATCNHCGTPLAEQERVFINWFDNIPRKDPRYRIAFNTARRHLEKCYAYNIIKGKIED